MILQWLAKWKYISGYYRASVVQWLLNGYEFKSQHNQSITVRKLTLMRSFSFLCFRCIVHFLLDKIIFVNTIIWILFSIYLERQKFCNNHRSPNRKTETECELGETLLLIKHCGETHRHRMINLLTGKQPDNPKL